MPEAACYNHGKNAALVTLLLFAGMCRSALNIDQLVEQCIPGESVCPANDWACIKGTHFKPASHKANYIRTHLVYHP